MHAAKVLSGRISLIAAFGSAQAVGLAASPLTPHAPEANPFLGRRAMVAGRLEPPDWDLRRVGFWDAPAGSDIAGHDASGFLELQESA